MAAWPSRGCEHLRPLTLIKTRLSGFRPNRGRFQHGPKRRATFIVARPGSSCKSRTKLLDFDGGDAFELLLDRLGLVLGRASFNALGAPSTRSLASFRPSEVTSRTALMVLILFAPASLRMTWNSVFSSAAGPAAAPPPPATATGAAAAPRRRGALQASSPGLPPQAGSGYNLFFQLCEIRHVFSPFNPFDIDIPGRNPHGKVSDAPDPRTFRLFYCQNS